jgi:hypothetical protein
VPLNLLTSLNRCHDTEHNANLCAGPNRETQNKRNSESCIFELSVVSPLSCDALVLGLPIINYLIQI